MNGVKAIRQRWRGEEGGDRTYNTDTSTLKLVRGGVGEVDDGGFAGAARMYV